MKKRITLSLLLFTAITANAQFTSTNGTSLVNAQAVGEPGANKGQVFVKNAPNFTGNKSVVKKGFKDGGIPAVIYNNPRLLGPGVYSKAIAGMQAVKRTANKIKNTLPTAPTNGAIIINNITKLTNNRAKIADDTTRKFVFRGNINIDKPILVGSNTTIWVDGVLNYNGVEAISFGGADFTPRGSKLDGVFSIRKAFSESLRKVGSDGKSPKADRDHNKALISDAKKNGKKNVVIKGTRRGRIVVKLGTERDVNNVLLPKVNGIVVLGGTKNKIENLKIVGAQNGIVFWGAKDASVINSFIDKSVYRGVHLHSSINSKNTTDAYGVVRNNLVTNSLVDGIDVDSFSSYWDVSENVIMGADDRFLLWTEIDAHHCDMKNNVGIILNTNNDPTKNKGFQENGTESSRNNPESFFKGTRENKWIDNNIFYAQRLLQGINMSSKRFIQRSTITFRNNYVWAQNANIQKFNPKRGVTNDVYYLTGTPQAQNSFANTDLKTLDITKEGSDFVLNGEEVSNNTLFEIYNIGGRLVHRGRGAKITTDGLSSGIYMVLINTEGKLSRKKIVVE